MIKKSKSQFALEFIILIAFMLLLFLGSFAVISSRILEAKEEENKQIAEKLANRVFDEINLAKSATDGYSRTFTILKKVKGSDYSIAIKDDRELVVNYRGNEHIIFLPANVQGNVDTGTNEINKISGVVSISPIAT